MTTKKDGRGGARENAGRPSIDVVVRKIALHPRHWEWADKEAKYFGISRNALIRDIMDVRMKEKRGDK